MLAGLYGLIDWKGYRRWAFPLIVIGMNSIAIYIMSWTVGHFVYDAIGCHLGGLLNSVGTTFHPVVQGFGAVLVMWAILFWMYRRKIFLRI